MTSTRINFITQTTSPVFVMEDHVRTMHPIPNMELVEGCMTRVALNTLIDWWADYRWLR